MTANPVNIHLIKVLRRAAAALQSTGNQCKGVLKSQALAISKEAVEACNEAEKHEKPDAAE